MGGSREGLGRLAYRSVTHPEACARPDGGLGVMLTAMPFSSDRAALPMLRLPYDPAPPDR
jgi:hypothetical protein